jgi:membrane protease subunit HflC
MNKSFLGFGALVALVVVLVLGSASVFTVAQTEQALVLRFGEPVGERALVTRPGLHFKLPFVENVVYFDKRILDVETPKQEVLAADNNRIEVDSFLRYRITNVLAFYRAVRTEEIAANQLGSIMNSVVRRVLGEESMIQIVREREREREVERDGKKVKLPSAMSEITRMVNDEAARLGVRVIEVRIRRADLPRQISEKVYGRMQTERQREAAEFRAEGERRKQEIQSRADRDVTVIRAEAQRQSEEIRGRGDADRNRIFADAFNKDPEFFSFYRSMQAYERGLAGNDTRMILSPTSDFFRYFGDPQGREPATKPRTEAPATVLPK